MCEGVFQLSFPVRVPSGFFFEEGIFIVFFPISGQVLLQKKKCNGARLRDLFFARAASAVLLTFPVMRSGNGLRVGASV